MAKLWDKGYAVDKEVEAFTTGDDYLLDRELVEADCVASAAHARMLAKIGILTSDEADKLAAELRAIAADSRSGAFTVQPADEDCHTAIENRLVARLGDLGKKIHTARSRNDQVIAATRVYAREKLLDLFGDTLNLCATLRAFAERAPGRPDDRADAHAGGDAVVGRPLGGSVAGIAVGRPAAAPGRLRDERPVPARLCRELRRPAGHRPPIHERSLGLREAPEQRALREQQPREDRVGHPRRLRPDRHRPEPLRRTSSTSACPSSATSSFRKSCARAAASCRKSEIRAAWS